MVAKGANIVLAGNQVEAVVKVTMDELANKTEYDAVKRKEFKVKLTYTVSNVQNN